MWDNTLPKNRFLRFCVLMVHRCGRHNVATQSAALAFYLLFMIFPFLIFISALLGLFGIAAALNGYLYKKIPVLFRAALIIGGLCMMIPGTLTDVAGLVLVAAVVAYQKISAKKHGGPVVTA